MKKIIVLTILILGLLFNVSCTFDKFPGEVNIIDDLTARNGILKYRVKSLTIENDRLLRENTVNEIKMKDLNDKYIEIVPKVKALEDKYLSLYSYALIAQTILRANGIDFEMSEGGLN